MAVSNRNIILDNDRKTVWNIVTSLQNMLVA